MDCKITDNFLCLPIGTKFYIKQGFVNKQINLLNNRNQNKFFAIFDENDVDFEICCDNRECDRGIIMKLTINKRVKSFYFYPKTIGALKALETYGRKLHFISQNSDDGRILVAQTANKYGMSYELASIICSRIQFNIEVEQCKKKVSIFPFSSIVTLIGTKITLFVKALSSKTYTIEIGLNNIVNDLKKIIAKKDGTPPNQQRLIFAGKQLEDDKELGDYRILHESTVHVLLSLSGGLGSIPPLTEVTDNTSLSASDKSDSLHSSSSDKNSNASYSGSKLFSGERGVICFGERSNQKFIDYYGFIKDIDIDVNSFVIEMRMESRFAPI